MQFCNSTKRCRKRSSIEAKFLLVSDGETFRDKNPNATQKHQSSQSISVAIEPEY